MTLESKTTTKLPRYYLVWTHGPDKGYSARKILNLDRLQPAGMGWVSPLIGWPRGYCNLEFPPWRFPSYLETPKILWNPKIGPFLDVMNKEKIYVISAAARLVFDAVDPDAFEYRECESLLPDWQRAPEAWLCTVKRGFCRAIDVNASKQVNTPHPDAFALTPPVSKVKFRQDVVGGAHIFHVADAAGSVCCDDVFRNACRTAKLTGIKFSKLF